MIGNWKWNLGLAGFSFVLSFLFSVENNTLIVSLIRSVYSFLLFFVLAFVPRFLLARINSQPKVDQHTKEIEVTLEKDNHEEFEPLVVSDITKVSQAVRQWSNE